MVNITMVPGTLWWLKLPNLTTTPNQASVYIRGKLTFIEGLALYIDKDREARKCGVIPKSQESVCGAGDWEAVTSHILSYEVWKCSLKTFLMLWLVWLSGLNTVLQIEGSPAQFLVGHKHGLWARSPVEGMREATNCCFSLTWMFLSLSFSPPPLSKNE